MKYLIFPAAIVLLMLCACTQTKCKLPALTYIQINDFDSTADSSMTFYRYSPDNDFTKLVDSVTIAFNGYNTITYSIFAGEIYDYIMVIRPSGVKHTMKNMSFGNEKGEQNGKYGICLVSYSYDLDDSNYHIAETQNDLGLVGNTPVIINN